MKKTLLATAVGASLLCGMSAWADTNAASAANAADQTAPAQANDQDQTQADKDKKAKTLDRVTVTGSLIPRSKKETAQPVITISGKDLQTEGFRNVYDALKTVSVSTGSTQDSQVASQGSFTPGATTISLFGLDPGFTLILLNGHPMADYPIPYNGTQNITDLSNIPTELVDHIDILSGGASSTYGSSAVAGVVNIVLKKSIEGFNVNLRGGGYQRGGGDNGRAQIAGGKDWGRLSLTYALSVSGQSPIRFDQSFWPSRLDNPLGAVAGRDFLLFEPFTNHYFDPGQAACDPSAGLFGGTLGYTNRPGRGYYCGSYFDYSKSTLMNKNKVANGYVNLDYSLNDKTDLYAEILYGVSGQTITGGSLAYQSQNPDLSQSANSFAGVFWDTALNDFARMQRIFSPEELGSLANEKILTHQYNVNVGIKGGIGSTNWDYDAFYNRSQVNTDDSQLWPLTQPFNNYYLGAQQGTDPYGYGFPAFNPNLSNLYRPITAAQFLAMSGWIRSKSVSWEQSAHVTLTNSELFRVDGEPAGLAVIAETGNQAFNNPVDPGLIAGLFNGRTGTQGSGSRSRWAVGGEFRTPLVTKKLIASFSARYDAYSFAGRSDAKPTYKVSLEFRPIDGLLFRGNYATAFRAPDMNYIFQGASGFYTSGNDYYLCRLAGYNQNNLSNCPQAAESLFSFYHGSPNLKDIGARTFSVGFVWSPNKNWDIQADYNNISIKNEVETQSPDALLQLEANCRLGVSFGGQPYDINSPQCQQALAGVNRFPFNDPFVLAQGQIQNVTTFPINIASEKLDGIQASTTFRHDIGKYGNLAFRADYYVELHHKQRQDPADPEIDLLHNFNSYEFKSRASGSVTWSVGPWSTTVFGTLLGKTVNAGGTGITGRWAQFNGSVQYNLDPTSYVSLTVNNLFNRKPPTDSTFAGSNAVQPPYYNAYVYNGYGTAAWLEFSKRF
ncbi:MAG: TonB-dependent receptor [Proteobacteria bacterium]|nr:TonB-dependent receptor [Pseudomonadota bacterium]